MWVLPFLCGHLVGSYILHNICTCMLMQDLAFDLSLAALLGDNIYNFGELLAHPIVKFYLLDEH